MTALQVVALMVSCAVVVVLLSALAWAVIVGLRALSGFDPEEWN